MGGPNWLRVKRPLLHFHGGAGLRLRNARQDAGGVTFRSFGQCPCMVGCNVLMGNS